MPSDLKNVFKGAIGPDHDENRYPDLPEDGEFTAPQGYKVYHGTQKKNLKSILKHGLDFRKISKDFPDPFLCFTEDPEVCEDYGDVVIEADLSGMRCTRFYDEGEDGGVWEVQCSQIVPPSRLKIWNG